MIDAYEFKIRYINIHNNDELIIKEYMEQIKYLEQSFISQIYQDLPKGILHPIAEYIKLKI